MFHIIFVSTQLSVRTKQMEYVSQFFYIMFSLKMRVSVRTRIYMCELGKLSYAMV
jgi:hypothetical protein